MNRRQKGRRNEFKAKKILEDAGYDVIIAPMSTRWAKQTDLFGLWDLIAVRHNEIRFIQVKSNHTAPPEDREAMSLWQCPDICSKELWIFKDRVKEPLIRIL